MSYENIIFNLLDSRIYNNDFDFIICVFDIEFRFRWIGILNFFCLRCSSLGV